MEIGVDKKALVYALELIAASVIIVVAAGFIAREGVFLARAPEEEQSLQDVGAPFADETLDEQNAFYLLPPGEKPIFLSSEGLLRKREALIWEQQDFAFADMRERTMTWYEKGVPRAAFPIVAAPKTGGFFDVPQGFYMAQDKAEQHISKSGRVRLSSVVYLFGNYLIHAAPAARASAARDETGIQLIPQDAKEFFARVASGTPILVSYADAAPDIGFTYFRKTLLPTRVPEVTAAGALARDIETGEILFEKNKNDAYPTASLTKLITAIVAEKHVKPDRILTVTDDALKTYGNSAELLRGETFAAADLFHGLILESSNDIAVMFQIAVPSFIAKMNEYVTALGLSKTFFEDSSGLSQNNVTSAADLFILLQEVHTKHPELLTLSRERKYSVVSLNKKRKHRWDNINWPAQDARYLGGKAGFTDESIQTMAGIWSARMSEYGARKIAVTLLGSRNRVRDVRAILGYLEHDFVYGFAKGANEKGKSASSVVSGASLYQAVMPPP